MKVAITGAEGFIGKNLCVALGERAGFDVLPIVRTTDAPAIAEALSVADAVVHLAGVNRPEDPAEFTIGNTDLTEYLCHKLAETGRSIPVAFSSSIQAMRDNPYGASKRAAEQVLEAHSDSTGSPVTIYRLPNVFGKWCRPNYNSVVATFCHNTACGLPVQVDEATAPLTLVYIDDVVEALIRFLQGPRDGLTVGEVSPVYETTVGGLLEQIQAFGDVRQCLVTEPVGTGLTRALYATYVSYLPAEKFSYGVPKYGDLRGVFVEMLKTKDSGQFSFFTAHPGITRGGHYHHSKTEKFLVIKGRARFAFRHILTDEVHSIVTDGDEPVIVETIPGWAHEVTNIGDEEMVVMLWANEIFDRERPDTIASKV